jgi:hypothetical protein
VSFLYLNLSYSLGPSLDFCRTSECFVRLVEEDSRSDSVFGIRRQTSCSAANLNWCGECFFESTVLNRQLIMYILFFYWLAVIVDCCCGSPRLRGFVERSQNRNSRNPARCFREASKRALSEAPRRGRGRCDQVTNCSEPRQQTLKSERSPPQDGCEKRERKQQRPASNSFSVSSEANVCVLEPAASATDFRFERLAEYVGCAGPDRLQRQPLVLDELRRFSKRPNHSEGRVVHLLFRLCFCPK